MWRVSFSSRLGVGKPYGEIIKLGTKPQTDRVMMGVRASGLGQAQSISSTQGVRAPRGVTTTWVIRKRTKSSAGPEKLMDHAANAGVQHSRRAEESRSDCRGLRNSTERALAKTTGCILADAGTPKGEFRVDGLCPGQKKHDDGRESEIHNRKFRLKEDGVRDILTQGLLRDAEY